MIVVVYWIKLYKAIMLNKEKLVANPALHYLSSSTIELILVIWDVNGAEIDASAMDKDSPISACFNAPQSLAPSPHIETFFPSFWYNEMAFILSFGLALAKTVVLRRMYFYLGVNLFWSPSKSKILFKAGPVIQSCTLGSFNLSIIVSWSFID